jgi:hypothetical protein
MQLRRSVILGTATAHVGLRTGATCLQVFQVDSGATNADIRSARRHLSRTTYPDKTRLADGSYAPGAQEAYALMRKACDTLLDAAARAEYLADMGAAEAAAARAAAAAHEAAAREAAAREADAFWREQEQIARSIQDERDGTGRWIWIGCASTLHSSSGIEHRLQYASTVCAACARAQRVLLALQKVQVRRGEGLSRCAGLPLFARPAPVSAHMHRQDLAPPERASCMQGHARLLEDRE